MYLDMNTYNKDLWFRFWQERIGNGGWRTIHNPMRGWIFRNIFGATGSSAYSKVVIGILRGRESVQIKKRVYARDSYKTVSKAKRFLEPMEFHKSKYNFERISAKKL